MTLAILVLAGAWHCPLSKAMFQPACASTLAYLASSSMEAGRALAAAGGIPALVKLPKTPVETEPDEARLAVAALRDLALDRPHH